MSLRIILLSIQYITALRISYSGRVWFGLFMFLFLSELCKIRLSDTVRSGLLVVHLITYIAVFTFQHHTLYYSSTNYVNSGIFPRLLHEKGILYYLFINLQTMYIIVGLAWLVILYGRERNETARHRIKMVIQLTGVHQLTRVYDVTTLINDILDFSKVEEGKMEIIPVQYDLSSLINDLVNMIRDSAAKKGLKLVVDVNENIPHYLIGDEIRIKQCALNVLTNAVKHTEKGTVCLKASYEKKDELNILLDLSVKDTGIGMKEQDMEKLFSPYKRIDEKYNRTVEGTGLGMTITRQLLELMGSELSVKSEYGKGTEVSFSIKQRVVSWEGIGNFSSRYNGKNNDLSDYHELFHAKSVLSVVSLCPADYLLKTIDRETLLKKLEDFFAKNR